MRPLTRGERRRDAPSSRQSARGRSRWPTRARPRYRRVVQRPHGAPEAVERGRAPGHVELVAGHHDRDQALDAQKPDRVSGWSARRPAAAARAGSCGSPWLLRPPPVPARGPLAERVERGVEHRRVAVQETASSAPGRGRVAAAVRSGPARARRRPARRRRPAHRRRRRRRWRRRPAVSTPQPGVRQRGCGGASATGHRVEQLLRLEERAARRAPMPQARSGGALRAFCGLAWRRMLVLTRATASASS